MLAPSGALKIVSSIGLCMLASEDHASHDARTTEASKIFELMRAFFSAASFDRGLQVSALEMEHSVPPSSRLPPRTECHPRQDTDKHLGAIFRKISRFRTEHQHYATKSVHRLSHLHCLQDLGIWTLRLRGWALVFSCPYGEELGGSMNVCLA